MPRLIKPLFAVLTLLVAAGAGWLVWSRSDQARDWAARRPALPSLAGEAAPGLDARLEKAAVLAPAEPIVWQRLGDPPAAQASLERALAYAPADGKIRTDLLGVLKALPDTVAAERIVHEGLSACPDSNAFRFDAGLLAARAGRTADAIAHFGVMP